MSSPSEFLTFYRTAVRATSNVTQTTSRCLAKPVATRPFSTSLPKSRANLEDTLMAGPKVKRNLEDTMMGGPKTKRNLEDTMMGGGPPKTKRNLEDTMMGGGVKK